MDDLISRQAAIDAICKACSMEEDYHKCDGYSETSTWCDELVALRALPSAQSEKTDNDEFWRKRASNYHKMCMSLISKMSEGVKIDSIKIDGSGIVFFEKKPEPYTESGREE